MENGTQMTLEKFMPETSQTQTAGASDSPARTSVLQENKQDLKETVRACFSELCTFLDSSKKKRDPLGYSLRMLKICLVLMEDGISPGFSLKWTRGGTMRNGAFSIPSTSESHKTGNAVLLSDILEAEVPQKYFLSKEQTEKIVFTESDKSDSCTEQKQKGTHRGGRVYDSKGQMRTLGSGNGMSKPMCSVIVKEAKYPSGNQKSDIFGVGGVSRALAATDYKQPVSIVQELSEIQTHLAKG